MGSNKATAVTRAQAAVAQAIIRLQEAEENRRRFRDAMRATPQPYWRSSVSQSFYKPDIVRSDSYTVCWSGVVSPYVCTSGAKACW